MQRRIEDYAIIGDCKSAALISLDGSVDWLCLPRFDSPGCFNSIVGTPDNGRWRIAPKSISSQSSHAYIEDTLVLSTRFEVQEGAVEIIDFMPIDPERSHLVREVRGVSGTVDMSFDLTVRFDYGMTVPWIFTRDDGAMKIVAGPDALILRASVPLEIHNGQIGGSFSISKGESIMFTLSHGSSHLPDARIESVATLLKRTLAFWTDWAGQCTYDGRWTSLVRRSLITLKSLSYMPTGGMVAAATTSLPEMIGNERNWDYRYCWLRDATFTLLAFLNSGYTEEAKLWREWVLRAIAGSPSQIQIMYGLAGERRLDEWVVPWLAGYEGSTPVRVGNAAASQVQLDIFGELSDAMAVAVAGGLPPIPRGNEVRGILLEYLEENWSKPDHGIWEIRGEKQHFVHSKVMAWVAFDRAAHGDHQDGDDEHRQHYRNVADLIHRDICEQGVDPDRNCFVQAYGTSYLDASLLLLAVVGFLPADDVRIINTVSEIRKRLLVGPCVKRYETDSGIDGLPPGEGAFLACSFWLIDNLVLQGRLEEAEAHFEEMISIANVLGLYSEEYDPIAKRQLGNFPQAFTHVSLVNSAFAIANAKDSRGGSEGRGAIHLARHRKKELVQEGNPPVVQAAKER